MSAPSYTDPGQPGAIAEEPVPDAHFNGSDYVDSRDRPRLRGQIHRIYKLMKDGVWRSLEEISTATGDPPASVSAQLRHLRKKRFGGHTVRKRSEGGGLFHYRLEVAS